MKTGFLMCIAAAVFCVAFLGIRLPLLAEDCWKETLLIINYNHPYYDSIPFLKKLYGKEFPNIVFYGKNPFSEVETVDHHFGWYGQKVLEHAMKKWPHYAGYLMINDDCMVNYWNLRRLDRKKIWGVSWHPFTFGQDSSRWSWWSVGCGLVPTYAAYQALPDWARTKIQENLGPNSVCHGLVDVIYIPERYRSEFLSLCPLFKNVFLEIALPTICSCLERTDAKALLNAVYLWDNDRKKYRERYSQDLDFLHPMKFSDPSTRQFAEELVKNH